MSHRKNTPRRAFTLIELLTVIAVIGILAAILIPTLSAVQANAKSSKSVSNLRQIGNSVNLYANANGGKYPLLDRKTLDSSEEYTWVEALEEVVLEWDRDELGKHPIFEDGTVVFHSEISDYGGNALFFGDSTADKYTTVYSIERPATIVVAATASSPSSPDNEATWQIPASYAESGSGSGVPDPRLSGEQVGVVYADGHADTIDGQRLSDEDGFRLKLFDPKAN